MFRKRRHKVESATGPHEFLEPALSRLGTIVGGARAAGAMGAHATHTAAVVQSQDRCALPGCARLRDDSVHRPPEPKGSR